MIDKNNFLIYIYRTIKYHLRLGIHDFLMLCYSPRRSKIMVISSQLVVFFSLLTHIDAVTSTSGKHA